MNEFAEKAPRFTMARVIMVVDDKANVRQMVKDYLTEQGFHVVTADNGRNALYVPRHEKPDLILLDIMMAEMDGYEFIRIFRKEKETPIILLTARLDETDKVVGLELGAEDFVTKPFGMAELVARIRAVLRRMEKPAADSQTLQVRNVVLNRTTRDVTVDNQAADLTPSEFELLATLMRTPGRVFSRTDLLEELQGHDYEGVERTIDVHIRNLRAKIEPDPANPIYIQTVFGVGYRFSPDNQA